MEEYDTEPIQTSFDLVKTEIQKFKPHDIVMACIGALRRIEEEPDRTEQVQMMRKFRPWELLLLIKWTFLYGNWDSQQLSSLTVPAFNNFSNLMDDLNGNARLPTNYDHFYLFFRNISFQQFWLQEGGSQTRFARQELLFGDLQKDHTFQREFQRITGIEIKHFIELAIMLIGRFVWQKEKWITEDWFRNVASTYPQGTIEKFLSLLSQDLPGIRSYLNTISGRYGDLSYEYYEQTPLKRYPLLKVGNKYHIYSVMLLMHSLQSFIYDTLREDNPGAFMDKFGKIFEEYIAGGVAQFGLPYLREDTLKQELGMGKTVDFLIVEQDCNILIDAKGVEMAFLGMVSHRAEVVLDKARSSIVKGIEQGFEVSEKIKDKQNVGELEIGKENFLLVVTFKDLYAGNGERFYETVGKDKIDEIRTKYSKDLLPLENIYFISADDFDILVALVENDLSSLLDILKKAREDDKDPQSSRFLFRMHLTAGRVDSLKPKYLDEAFYKVEGRCRERLEG